MKPTNLLVLMSAEHNPKFLGAAGHPFIETPNLDALAAFGRYVNKNGHRDDADGYDGAVPSWHHALRDAGHRVVSIGEMH
jgi:choline-sulfatase